MEKDIEMGARTPARNSDMGMEAFTKQIQEVEKQVYKLASLLKKLKEANEESKSVTKASAMKGSFLLLHLYCTVSSFY
ncbi:hypothetical protein CRG98_011001 [Punica granatum]|uniref:Syntaxin N-terminal domain-containing protein n=1 Tax=Punica granatum TaxID=22663 RepID=A0A2I0KJ96_PUNGR|nr:hypothetical protein CRG98_011001 [Punica granatum]